MWCSTMSLSWEFLYGTVLPTYGSFHKQSHERWRVVQKIACFLWKGFMKLAVLLWYSVSKKRSLAKQKFRTIDSQAISGREQCFQVSEWTSSAPDSFFVQTELVFSNFVTNLIIAHLSVWSETSSWISRGPVKTFITGRKNHSHTHTHTH
jgi:hypothetical protein